jgi:uncharacterized membrane protein YcaP (DUF421 family)
MLILAIRVFGRRTLAMLSPVDLLIVMLLGSSVETGMVHGSTALRGGLVSAAVLLVLNRLLTLLMLGHPRLRNIVAGGPMVIVSNGRFVQEHLKRAGMTEEDALHALRERECGDPDEVRLAVLEPDGQVNVVFKEKV